MFPCVRIFPRGWCYPHGSPARVVLFHICGTPARDGTKSLLLTYIFLRRHHGFQRTASSASSPEKTTFGQNAIFTLLLHRRKYNLGKRKHRFWVHEILRRRLQQGAYNNLVQELELHAPEYHRFFRMSAGQMEHVLMYVGPKIRKKSFTREAIGAKERLCICIR